MKHQCLLLRELSGRAIIIGLNKYTYLVEQYENWYGQACRTERLHQVLSHNALVSFLAGGTGTNLRCALQAN